MKLTLQLEEWAQFGLSIYIFSMLDFAWWWFPVLFFLPDLSMIGYALGTKSGATVYNLFHNKALAIVVGVAGYYSANQEMMLAGIILYGHAAFDRGLGYGLKYNDDFKHTHLGWIGGKV